MTVEVLLRATIVFVFLMKMTENIQVMIQWWLRRMKSKLKKLGFHEMHHSDVFSLQVINQSSDLQMTIDGTK